MPFAHLFLFGGTKRRDDDVHSSDGNGGGARLRNQRTRPQTATQGWGQQRKRALREARHLRVGSGGSAPTSSCPVGGIGCDDHNRKKGTLIGEKLPGKSIGPPFRLPSVGPSSNLLWAWGECLLPHFVPSRAYKEGDRVHVIIKASVVGSALMLLASCAGYLTNYQTPCVQGHVCECVQYTTANRSWLDCRDYGRVKSKAY